MLHELSADDIILLQQSSRGKRTEKATRLKYLRDVQKTSVLKS